MPVASRFQKGLREAMIAGFEWVFVAKMHLRHFSKKAAVREVILV